MILTRKEGIKTAALTQKNPSYGKETSESPTCVGKPREERTGGSDPIPISKFSETTLMENMNMLAPPQDAVSGDSRSSRPPRLIPLSQTLPSQLNGVYIPQRKYNKGAGRGFPNYQNLVPFLRQDGTYISVDAAIQGDCAGLLAPDVPALSNAGYTVTLRFEVSRPPLLRDNRTDCLRSGPGTRRKTLRRVDS